MFWEIWNARNRWIFKGVPPQHSKITGNIALWINDRPCIPPAIKDLSKRIWPDNIELPTLYFDGANKDGLCGCGAWIKLENKDRYHMFWNGGVGSNNKVEIMELWSGILISYHLNLPSIHIYGDSKYTIDGISGRCGMQCSNSIGWV